MLEGLSERYFLCFPVIFRIFELLAWGYTEDKVKFVTIETSNLICLQVIEATFKSQEKLSSLYTKMLLIQCDLISDIQSLASIASRHV